MAITMTAELFKGQDYRLVLNIGINLTGATTLKILYTKPFGAKGEWNATADDQSIYYDVPAVENDMAGIWSFEAYIVDQDGKTFYGGIVKKLFFDNIK